MHVLANDSLENRSTMLTQSSNIEVVVVKVAGEAQGINVWEFKPFSGAELPPFTAGAHIDLHLSNGLVRSYSLCNSQDDRHRYVVAINNDSNGRGGSKLIHETLLAGSRLEITPPRNHFPLVEDAKHVVFIAGGIGITPIYGMIQRLEKLDRSWELHYSARVPEMCAFKSQFDLLEDQRPGRVHFNFDHLPGGKMLDLNALIKTLPFDAHYYCCGPNPMLKAFAGACAAAGLPSQQVHIEYFTAKEEASVEGGFTVVLQRSGKSFEIPTGNTILDTLLANGISVPYSCTQGVCASCETTVIEGVPDHRDSVLSPAEQASNKTMMICCSGSKSKKLVLDI
jgi:ferredoxin-NADP reductase